MQIVVFHGTDRPSGEIKIDSKLLVEIPRYGGAGKGCPTPEAKGSIFSKLINLLRNVGRPQRFTMTMVQSQRVREIVGQADADTLMAAKQRHGGSLFFKVTLKEEKKMNKYSLVKRTIMALSFLAIIIAGSSFGSGCFAGSPPNLDTGFEGSWTGQARASNGNLSVVYLNLQQNGRSTLTYENPRSCALTVKFLKNNGDNGREYSFTESTGGFCDKLLLGKLSLMKQGDKSLSCELTSRDDISPTKISEKGMLSRCGK
ncbi:MAG: hypothetical protein WC256_03590 [Desulfurivibrionaceae bacterium]|jgi:hypothetical protein